MIPNELECVWEMVIRWISGKMWRVVFVVRWFGGSYWCLCVRVRRVGVGYRGGVVGNLRKCVRGLERNKNVLLSKGAYVLTKGTTFWTIQRSCSSGCIVVGELSGNVGQESCVCQFLSPSQQRELNLLLAVSLQYLKRLVAFLRLEIVLIPLC